VTLLSCSYRHFFFQGIDAGLCRNTYYQGRKKEAGQIPDKNFTVDINNDARLVDPSQVELSEKLLRTTLLFGCRESVIIPWDLN
jgi:hypothetical protein